MICTVEVELNAAHPELPLNEASTFVGSPSAVFVKKVPRSVGNWKLTKVYVSFAYPDNSLVTAEAVATGGVWVATLSACDTSGRTLNGFQISADGIDENGNAVEGYVLGIGDLSVCNRDRTVAPGVTAYNLRYFDTAPTSPKKGDVAPNANGDQLYYNGSSWVPFANVANKADLVDGKVPSSQLPGYVDDVLEFASRSAFPATGESGKIYVAIDTNRTYRWSGTQYTEIANPALDDAVTKNSSNGVKSSGIWSAIWGALSALPTGFSSLYDWVVDQLALKANDNAVVHLTGEQQTISAVLQLMSTLYAESGVESHGDYRLTWRVGGDYAGTVTISQDTISVQLANEQSARQYKLQAGGGGTLALLENIAPAFVYFQSYGVNELCTSFDADSNHKGYWLYKCIAATDGSTPPETDTTHWTLATVEDVLAALRTAIAGKADVSAIPYDRITITTGQLQDHAVQKVTLNAATTTLVLPALTDLTGKVSDFGIDVVNGYEVSGTPTAASFSLAGTIGTDYNLIVPEGEDWSEMSALAAGEMAQFYFTLSAFAINDKPTWKIVKQTVELVPVPVAP